VQQRRADADKASTSTGGKLKASVNPLVWNILQVSPSLAIFCSDLRRSESAKPRRIKNVATSAKKIAKRCPELGSRDRELRASNRDRLQRHQSRL
jgi:hypothetical protein